MIRTTIKIWKADRRLSKIQQQDYNNQEQQLIALQKDLGLVLPVGQNNLLYRINGVHTWLQTKIMLLACMWAAIAALFACISSVMALVTVFSD
jgi:hypothetical protein